MHVFVALVVYTLAMLGPTKNRVRLRLPCLNKAEPAGSGRQGPPVLTLLVTVQRPQGCPQRLRRAHADQGRQDGDPQPRERRYHGLGESLGLKRA